VAIVLGGQAVGPTPGAINITWSRRAFKRAQAVAQFAEPVREAATAIAEGLARRL
jgi:hypothetical protein